ncbi:MAG: hypothetical protein ACOCX3_03385 [Chloroflexota bacterium]
MDSVLIQVVIGLVFVFSLMAILVTQVNTVIQTTLNLRAKELKRGLLELLSDRQVQAKVLAHPIINMVQTELASKAQGKLTESEAEAIIHTKASDVAYIDPEAFAEALFSILLQEAESTLFSTFQQAIESMGVSVEKSQLREKFQSLRESFSEATLRDIYAIVQNLPEGDVRSKLINGIEDIERTVAALRFEGGDLVPLLNGVEQINDPHLRSALRTLLQTARDIEEAKQSIINWFNQGMSRVSDTFKKNLQRYSILVALILSILFNVDTVHLARSLWVDDELRRSVVAAAVEADLDELAPGIAVEEPETTSPDEAATADDDATLEDLEDQASDVRETAQILLELQLPIGWEYVEVTDSLVQTSLDLGIQRPYENARNIWNFIPGNTDNWFELWLQKIIGILVTTVAASQGAPFWFDLLRRLTTRPD